ncbi:replication-relaxation family protein [Candidatus Micrarchaeota archaeon]|nr:replication-relaxation family protein [Candidatus Micrarchaeota archaeon]
MDKLIVTPKQLEILLLLYRFRFLDRTHIQRFLNHKDRRRINAWLRDLSQRNIIGRKYSRSLKENTKPAIYHLSTQSRKILLEEPNIDKKSLKRVYREKNRSKKFIEHWLLLADIYFYLDQQLKDEDKLHFFTKVDLRNHCYLPYKRPDAYIAIESKDITKRYFLEILDPETPRFILRNKISSYIEYFDEEIWQEKTNHQNPSILLVCPDETIKKFLFKHSKQVLEEEADDELKFYLATRDDIRFSEMDVNVWELVEDKI